jgi:hypothetical protein
MASIVAMDICPPAKLSVSRAEVLRSVFPWLELQNVSAVSFEASAHTMVKDTTVTTTGYWWLVRDPPHRHFT